MFLTIRRYVRLIPTAVFLVLFYTAVSITQAGDVRLGFVFSALALIPLAVVFSQVVHLHKS